ncbi:unnamed protein product [Heligmosomoides polygyrus]|uniref:AIRS_C domain-containing protein n=1 Tax=Heligmosomoides polygyrus TaxID=6339 RepID=A0A183GJX1_HELPZ|nr:unnamed protein product [Heligmosomoides polygyrus]
MFPTFSSVNACDALIIADGGGDEMVDVVGLRYDERDGTMCMDGSGRGVWPLVGARLS